MSDTNRKWTRDDFSSVSDVVSRRQLLIGGTVLGGGAIGMCLVFSSKSEEVEQLRAVEDQLVSTARRFETTDVSNPLETGWLHHTTSMAVGAVATLPTEELPDDPQIEQRVNAVITAAEYYNQVAETLDSGLEVSSQLKRSEETIVNHTSDDIDTSVEDIETDGFRNSISNLAENDIDSEPTAPTGDPLIPDQEQVVTDLRAQQAVLESHLTAHQSYLESSLGIPPATRALEESNYETAQSSLRDVKETLIAGQPSIETTYGVKPNGLTLENYISIFELRRLGVEKLITVSKKEVSEEQREENFNEAIELFLEARTQVI